jgi:hypothetical protein
MKQKIILIGMMLAITLCVSGCDVINLFNQTAVKPKYYTKTKTSEPLEEKYTKLGKIAFKSKTFALSGKKFKKCKIWFPTDMNTSQNNKYSVVVFSNGTDLPYDKYEPLFKHLASWGFIVIGNDDKNSWNGLSSSQSLEFILSENENRNSIFYQKVNTNQIGISGHSQGGVGAINAVTNYENGKFYRSVFGASTCKLSLALRLKWSYDISKINIPYFSIAGTGPIDTGSGKDDPYGGIVPLTSMVENFNKLPKNITAIRARLKNADHDETLYQADGYMTAWFLYTLTNDNEAKQVFTGAHPELMQNQSWQDVEMRDLQ